jgi:hypothetical protein
MLILAGTPVTFDETKYQVPTWLKEQYLPKERKQITDNRKPSFPEGGFRRKGKVIRCSAGVYRP